jgi:tRNA(adenine34) deaminase
MSARPSLTEMENSMLMRFALAEAEHALKEGEIPIGCVVAVPGEHGLRIIGRGFERGSHQRHEHAVQAALAAATGKLRPNESGIVVVSTVEPCAPCMQLCRAARARQVIFGVGVPAESGMRRLSIGTGDSDESISIASVMAKESRDLLLKFIEHRRGSRDAMAYAQQLVQRPATKTHAA